MTNDSMEMYEKIRKDALEAVNRMSDYVVKQAASPDSSLMKISKATEIAEAWSRILMTMDRIILSTGYIGGGSKDE